ncbi:MAG TPA: tRNA dihydrouridine(20/20a) synthase DusA, partial [Gammaproteobacteria bacterium]|nr:tRNA dihydrouridine(20/20a) synthase DusA [Gammaproteobacteria bacterium]
YFLRLISRHVLLYTEMVTTGAVLRGDRARLLAFDPAEHPVALQLGGSDPRELAAAARIGADRGYDEINLNVGCPSDRVKSGRFGACLMLEPVRVAEAVAAMAAAVSVPVTVKTRIGVDEHDSYEALHHFVGLVKAAGARAVIVHARKAWLQGLSPKENREVPPLRYDVVYRLKRDFPDLPVVLNGGVTRLDGALGHLPRVDGIMLGRAAYHDPYLLAHADRRVFGDRREPPERSAIVEALIPYLERELARGAALQTMTRHVLGLFQGVPGARAWRRHISEQAHRPGAGPQILREALGRVAERSAAGASGPGPGPAPRKAWATAATKP